MPVSVNAERLVNYAELHAVYCAGVDSVAERQSGALPPWILRGATRTTDGLSGLGWIRRKGKTLWEPSVHRFDSCQFHKAYKLL